MNIKDKKGSISIFVLVALLFMSAFLILLYANNVNKSKDVKEQFNIINGIYEYTGGDEGAYDKAYTNLRKENKQTLTATVEDSSTLELTKTFQEKVSNYRIYGTAEGVGDLIDDIADTNYGKYKLEIKIMDENGSSLTANIYLDELLYDGDYIDFRLGKVVRADGTKKSIELPEISTFEDYTKIEVLTLVVPSRIELEYTGYTLD